VTAVARWRAWSTHVELAVVDAGQLRDATEVVTDRMAAVDAACSRFRPDSELRRLRPGRQQLGPLLAELVAAALQSAQDTDGLVHPGLGRTLRSAGYDRSFADLPRRRPRQVRTTPAVDWRSVRLHGDELELPSGVELDLGATAKAWVVDDIARRLGDVGVRALIGVGGDMAVAGKPPEAGWPVAVGDLGGPIDVVELRGALATSSTARRTWRCGGQLLHHVLDPRTGAPAPPVWRTVSVAAPSCLAANTASTAAVVMGETAPRWLEVRALPARLVALDGTVCCIGGWPPEDCAA
jgi:thiamine biosynthesis lipoprotein